MKKRQVRFVEKTARRRDIVVTSRERRFLERARGASKQVLIAVVVTSLLRRAKTETPLVFVDDPASFAEKLEEISISIMIRWRKVSVSPNSSAFVSQKILCSFLFKFQLWQKIASVVVVAVKAFVRWAENLHRSIQTNVAAAD